VQQQLLSYFFFAPFFFAGRLLPNEPLNRFPFAVFLSPLPIKDFILKIIDPVKIIFQLKSSIPDLKKGNERELFNNVMVSLQFTG
jgi:hypothetical protein